MRKIFTNSTKNIIAEKVVQFIGIVVVSSIIGIALDLVLTTIPLFTERDITKSHLLSIEENKDQAKANYVLTSFKEDELIFLIDDKANIVAFEVDSGQEIARTDLPIEKSEAILDMNLDENGMLSIFYSNGRGLLIEPKLENADNSHKIVANQMQNFEFDYTDFKAGQARFFDSQFTYIILKKSGEITFLKLQEETNFLGEITTNIKKGSFIPELVNPTIFLLDTNGNNVYLANDEGFLEKWDLTKNIATLSAKEKIADQKIVSATLILGDTSLYLALDDGTNILLESSPKKEETGFKLRYKSNDSQDRRFTRLGNFSRNRVIWGSTAEDDIIFKYSTTNTELFKIKSEGKIQSLNVSRNQKRLIVLQKTGQVNIYNINIPYPEASFKTFFAKLQYESYNQPSFTWQSSSSQDDFEPKLSFVPLILGSFKGTLYAMLIAAPIAFFAAIYLSQFASDALRRIIKPVIEVMSCIPSVVIGFLASLWLGPGLEKYFLHFVLFFPILIITYLASYWIFVNTYSKKIKTEGLEFLLGVPIFFISLLISYYLGDYILQIYFEGSLIEWMYTNWSIKYEQQNAIVTAIALGIAVLPIIFTLTDDALKTVPESFKAGSLALGANRWQTLWRLVVPSASPGIFAAFILGASRAIGETMIVLMASGNTPITDFGLFSGMRTLSANIAVEIPEAPFGHTLYRVLFLSGLILFLITFVFNFFAEFIRHRLRSKYQRV